MNIAWGTAAILALLLPGFFFIRGLGLAEPFSRDATPRSPIAVLALAVLISLLVHAAGLALLGWLSPWPADLEAILLVSSGQLSSDSHIARVAAAITPYPAQIAVYFTVVSVLSLAAAWGVGSLAIKKPWFGRVFYEHEWLHGYKQKNRPALVYALTNIEFGNSLLMYHGELDRFGIRQDGRFSFVVLRDARRTLLPRPLKDERALWTRLREDLASDSRLYLDGESITNLVLDPVPEASLADASPADVSAAMDVVRTAAAPPPPLAAPPPPTSEAS